ncbi:MAG: T9SS type A sorting domain-containing protein [Bradyrhizobiaceae bacterium]|nr:T9SS type A sorting domain-containing protein [Bradyrhizobiaceae bacterium]
MNSRWVYLETWCHDKQYNFDVQGDSARWDYTNAELSNISRTKTFALAPSDTVSFYREYFWLDKTTNSYNTSKFVSSNSISVVVELVNAENGLRLTLLDSMHIASTGSNQPCVVSWKPAIARIARQATSIEDTVSAYMQVRVATGGSNAGTFMRYDMLRTSFSKTHLADAGWQDYARNVAEDNNCSQSCTFLAEPLANPRGIQVSIAPGQTAVDALTIFDINGNVLNTTTLPTSSPYTVSVTSSGVYVVVGFKAGSPICTVVTYVQ